MRHSVSRLLLGLKFHFLCFCFRFAFWIQRSFCGILDLWFAFVSFANRSWILQFRILICIYWWILLILGFCCCSSCSFRLLFFNNFQILIERLSLWMHHRILEPIILCEPILVLWHLELHLFWQCWYLILNIWCKNTSDIDIWTNLKRPQDEGFGHILQEDVVVEQELLDTDTDYCPSIWLYVQRDLDGASVHILELFVDITQGYLRQPSFIYHVVQVHHAVLPIRLVQQYVNELSSQS